MALSRSQKRLAAIRRAERRLQHRLDDIDWELDELAGEIAELGQLEASKNVTIELEAGDVPGEDQD